MLLAFKVANYRSIDQEQVISLIPATNQKEHLDNILLKGKFKALNAISLYGPNGGGKSNLLMAMGLLNKLVQISARTSSTTKLPYDPFLLREGGDLKPTFLEITFVTEDAYRYRYGLAFTDTQIKKEWLYRKGNGREVSVFEREADIIDVRSGFYGSKKLIDAAIEATRDNALFLSICDVLNIEEAKKILKWFSKLNKIGGLNAEDGLSTELRYDKGNLAPEIRQYLTKFGFGLIDIEIAKEDVGADLRSDTSDTLQRNSFRNLKGSPTYKLKARHKIYNAAGAPTDKEQLWDFGERESAGTQKAFKNSGPILWTLSNGGVLIIDEIEASLHPAMTLEIIDLFLNKSSNRQNAQLIFATQATNLLSYAHLRRDQICFAEKNKGEGTEVYSLSDFVYFEQRSGAFKSEKERSDADKEKRYLEGRYGAIPALGDFQQFIQNKLWQDKKR